MGIISPLATLSHDVWQIIFPCRAKWKRSSMITKSFYRWEVATPYHCIQLTRDLFQNDTNLLMLKKTASKFLMSLIQKEQTSDSLLHVDLVTIQDRWMQLKTACCQFPAASRTHLNTGSNRLSNKLETWGKKKMEMCAKVGLRSFPHFYKSLRQWAHRLLQLQHNTGNEKQVCQQE